MTLQQRHCAYLTRWVEIELTLQPLLSRKHLLNANCVPGLVPAPPHCPPACWLYSVGEAEGRLCLAALKRKICVYITQSILYLFWILSSDIKAADINLQGQKLALMDPIKVIIDGSCTQHHCDLSKSLHRYQYC